MNRTILAIVGDIIQASAREFCCPRAAIISEGRTKSVAEARCCAMAVARSVTRFSLPELGRAFERDHTTVLAGIKTAARKASKDKSFARAMASVMKKSRAMMEERLA